MFIDRIASGKMANTKSSGTGVRRISNMFCAFFLTFSTAHTSADFDFPLSALPPEIQEAADVILSTDITNDQVNRLRLQHRLDYGAPLADATFIGTHNSNSSLLEDGGGVGAFSNHVATIEQQLDYGARLLNYDIYENGGSILMCHGICFGHEKSFNYGLRQIKDWLNKSGNANEVIVLFIQDGLDGNSEYNSAVSDIQNQLSGKVYTPKHHFNTDKECSYLPLETISKQKMLNDGFNVLLVSFKTSRDESCDKNGHSWRDWVWGAPVLDVSSNVDSRAKRYRNQWLNIAENRAPLTGGKLSFSNGSIDEALSLGIGLVGLDYMLLGPNRHEGLIWSWIPNQPDNSGNQDCAVLRFSGGWEDRACSQELHAACQSTLDGHWKISNSAGTHANGQSLCNSLPGDYIFSVPINANLNEDLRQARITALQSGIGVTDVWLNYSDTANEGDWVAHNFVSRRVQELNGATHTFNFSNNDLFRYRQIPVDSEFTDITFVVQGGDGGDAHYDDGAVFEERGRGGGGARIVATFKIGYGANEIKPGSGLGFVVGEKGRSDSGAVDWFTGSGGGGSAVLLFPPDSDDWKPLVVAGAGGGGYANAFKGRGGESAGHMVSASSSGGGTSAGDVDESGAGGGYLKHGEDLACGGGGGRAGRFSGGKGGEAGDGSLINICPFDPPYRNGGYGFGGGGSSGEHSISGGGGGGGYQGGDGGVNGEGGKAGGSFVDAMRLSRTVTSGSSTTDPKSGYITVSMVNNNGVPLARCIDRTVAANTTSCSAWVDIDNGTTDPDGDSFQCTQSPAAPYGLGVREVELCCGDSQGGSCCYADVTVLDQTAPTFLDTPWDETVECTSLAGAFINISRPVEDACDSSLIVGVDAFGQLPIGEHVITWDTTDDSGNTAEVSQGVTVVDTTPPSVTPPANLTAECTSPTGTPIASLGNPSIFDQCSYGPFLSASNNAPSSFDLGATQVEWKSFDDNGNQGTATQTVTIVDTVSPVVVAPANQTAECESPSGTTVVLNTPSITEVCDANPTIANNAPSSFALGTTQVAWTITDSSGNAAATQNTVTVADTTAPAIVPPSDLVAECTSPVGTPVDLGSPASITEACDTNPAIANNAPSSFALGSTQVTWTATDNSSNAGTAIQTVTVADTTAPAIVAPADLTAECTSPAGTPVALGTPASVTDACDANPALVNNAPQNFSLGATPVTWTATDNNSNVGSAVQSVTVVDTTAPVISCPADIVSDCNNIGEATITPGVASGSDICGGVSLTSHNTAVFGIGTHTLTYTATDQQGLQTSCTSNITVQCVNDAPDIVSVSNATQSLQYSDRITPIEIIANDPDSDTLTLTQSGAPDGLSISESSCEPYNGGQGVTCQWTLSGQVLSSESTYPITLTVSDQGTFGDNTPKNDSDSSVSIEVVAEAVDVSFDENNLSTLEVTTSGGYSGLFSLNLSLSEEDPDTSTGTADFADLSNAEIQMELIPIADGYSVFGSCSKGAVVGNGATATLPVSCTLNNVPVNVYTVSVTVDGGYYLGSGESGITVYDASLGEETEGGAKFKWPGTDNKTKINFEVEFEDDDDGFIEGKLRLTRKIAKKMKFKLKSNSVDTLVINPATGNETYGWASFTGTGTLKDPDKNVTYVSYIVYVEDRGNNGDKVWVEVRDIYGVIIPEMSLPAPAEANAIVIDKGEIEIDDD